MRQIILSFLIALLSGCSSMGNVASTDNLVSNSLEGAWRGDILQFTTKTLPEYTGDENVNFVLLNCNDNPEIWLRIDETGFHKIYGNYEIDSKSGNHLLSVIVDGGGWVETQSWALISISNNRAAVQWNRMISNPGLEDNEELRSWGQLGFGEIEKISSDCDIWDEGTLANRSREPQETRSLS